MRWGVIVETNFGTALFVSLSNQGTHREIIMAITQAVCNSFKVEILKGLHNFTATTGNAFKLALYDNEATLSKSTTVHNVPLVCPRCNSNFGTKCELTFPLLVSAALLNSSS